MKVRQVFRFALGLFLSMLVVEGGLRIVKATPMWRALPVVPPVLGGPDRKVGYSFTPNLRTVWIDENRTRIEINELGLRDSGISLQKPSGTLRVALTGDSYIEALQVNQRLTFDAVTERILAGSGLNAEIANLGMSGHGPLRQFVRLRRKEPILSADMALSFIRAGDFVNKDLFDDSKHPAYVPDGNGGLKEGTAFKHRLTVRLSDHPVFIGALWAVQNIEVVRIAYWLYKKWVISALLAQAAKKKLVQPQNRQAIDVCMRGSLERQKSLWLENKPREHWRRVEKFLNDYSDWSRRTNVPVLVAFFLDLPPHSSQVCGSEKKLRKSIFETARREFSRRGFAFLDFERLLAKRLIKTGKPLQIYGFRYKQRGHLNPIGHRIYAEIISEEIAKFATVSSFGKVAR